MSLFRTLSHLFHPQRSNNHRPRVLHPEALIYFSVIALAFGFLLRGVSFTTLGSVLGYASNIDVEQVVVQTNSERAKAGLAPLTLNSQLSQAALSKGQDMFSNQYWAHTSPSGKEPWAFISEAGYTYRVAGENLARDFGHTNEMISAWMASPTHRANIMNSRYEEIGIAVINGTLQGVETTLVVQMFGSPRLVAQAPTTPATSTDQSITFAPAQVNAQSTAQPNAPSGATLQPELPDAIGKQETLVSEQQQQSLLPETSNISESALREPVVLAGVVIPEAMIHSPLVSPLQLMKAFFLAIVLLLLATLVYDFSLAQSRKTIRFVGKNLAHILLFSLVAFLLIFFKGVVVG